MTQKQARQLTAATARAEREQVTVRGTGTRRSDGATCYAVQSCSDASRWYVVAVEATGRLSCDCPAGQYGAICKHKAATRARIKADREAAAAARVEFADTDRWALIEAGQW